MSLDHASRNDVTAGSLRHDVMNRLGVILGYSEVIAFETDDPEMKEAMVEIGDAATGIRDLVERLAEIVDRTQTQ